MPSAGRRGRAGFGFGGVGIALLLLRIFAPLPPEVGPWLLALAVLTLVLAAALIVLCWQERRLLRDLDGQP